MTLASNILMKTFRPGSGYWVSPTNHCFIVTRHIEEVCRCPEAFGVSEQNLRELFLHFDEARASEGTAREVVICALVKEAGWIRVRHYPRRGSRFSVNVPDFESGTIVRVRAFFQLLLTSGADDDNVLLDAPNGQKRTTVRELVDQGDSRFPAHVNDDVSFVQGPLSIPEPEKGVSISITKVTPGSRNGTQSCRKPA